MRSIWYVLLPELPGVFVTWVFRRPGIGRRGLSRRGLRRGIGTAVLLLGLTRGDVLECERNTRECVGTS